MAESDTFVVDAPLPRIRSAEAREGLHLVVIWDRDGPGAAVQMIDLAPILFRYKLYAPLRDDDALFRTVRVTDDGFALAWGDGDELDMASTTLAELAEQAMTPADFAAFMKRNGYTLDSVAAELGISQRLAADYAKDREVPRMVALACRYLDRRDVALYVPGTPGVVGSVMVGSEGFAVQTQERSSQAAFTSASASPTEAGASADEAVWRALASVSTEAL